MNKLSVFYCWQSDTHRKTTRGLIESALIDAVGILETEHALRCRIDHDTRDVTGAPGITASIQRKIQNCAVFVADLTIVGKVSEKKSMPNPNVLVEFGYALSSVGEESVVGVMNTHYGDVDELPFDVSQHAIRAKFTLAPDSNRETIEKVRMSLCKSLVYQIQTSIDSIIFHDASEAARRVLYSLVSNSETGSSLDRGHRIESFADELSMSPDDLLLACEELELNGWVDIQLSLGSTLGEVTPTNKLFWDFDRIYNDVDPQSDALKIVDLLVSKKDKNPRSPSLSSSEIEDVFAWNVRRINPAISYLVEHDLVDVSGVRSYPWIYLDILESANTRSLIRSMRSR